MNRELIKRVNRRLQVTVREVQIDGRMFQMRVSEQQLDGSKIGSCLHVVRGKTVSTMSAPT